MEAEAYLNTARSPDDPQHSLALGNIVLALRRKYPDVKVHPGTTSKVRDSGYSAPDIAVMLAALEPHIIIEVLSEEDCFIPFDSKLREYAAMGVPNIWVFEPHLREMFEFRDGSWLSVKDDIIATREPRIELIRAEVFPD